MNYLNTHRYDSPELDWVERRNKAYLAWVDLLDNRSYDRLDEIAVQLKIQNLMEAERYFARRAKAS